MAAWRATSYYNSVGHFLALKNHRHVFAGDVYFAAARGTVARAPDRGAYVPRHVGPIPRDADGSGHLGKYR